MPKRSLRSVLGTSSHRVRKQSALTPRKPRSRRPLPDDADDASGNGVGIDADDEEHARQLPDLGPVARLEGALLSDLSLRDVPQAMRAIRARMFTPLPPTGLHSTRAASIRAARRAIPPLVAPAHLAAVLGDPSAVEREAAQLWAAGLLRRVRVPRRGGAGEALIESGDFFEALAGGGASSRERDGFSTSACGLSEAARAGFAAFLRAHPTARTYQDVPQSQRRRDPDPDPGRGSADGRAMGPREVDELVRAGFLASEAPGWQGGDRLLMRPEDRTTLTSIERVSRHASGTVSAVGGRNAVHLAGGGGGGPASATPLRIAVPGHGLYMKLAEGTAQWLRDLLATRPWAEGTEAWARERFEGGGLYGTRWKEFLGVEWDWVLGQAVGLGVVEVFDTGSVGRGVRGLA